MTWLQITWFMLLGLLFTAFAILDGFDLGVGFWYLRAKGDRERRTLLNAVGPFWDGNEVWLLTAGGALFAAFAPVYAAVFSGFYLAMMLVLLALISRAVSLEFRSKEDSEIWRSTWDIVFSVSSIMASILFGVALGNVLRGVPLNQAGYYTGTFLQLLNPYAILIALTGLSMIAFQGANFILLKTEGALKQRAQGWAFKSGIVYGIMFAAASAVTIVSQPRLLSSFIAIPVLFIIPLLGALFIGAAIYHLKKERLRRAFIFSSLSIASMMGITGASLFPVLLPASNDPALSLTITNSASSELTLMSMLILALAGVPLVAAYTICPKKQDRPI
jgi:cytochrome d ubiquinol oxidase subunit II